MSRRRNRFRLLSFFILATIALWGCEVPKEPVDWSWDTHLYVPLSARTYGMWDLADPADTLRRRGSGIGMTDDSSLYFLAYRAMEVSFRDSIYLDPRTYAAVKLLRSVTAPVDLDRTDELSLARLNPEIAAQHGNTISLPPHPLNDTTSISFGARVISMTVDTGSVTLTVTNTLPYPVGDLNIGLDDRAGHIYPLLQDASLSAGGQVSQRFSLADRGLLDAATLVISATGTGGSAVEVDSARGLTVRTQIDTLQANPYQGIIAPQRLDADSTVHMEQRHRLHLGIIDEGILVITVSNRTQLDDTVSLLFPSITTQAGDPLVSRQFVPQWSERTDTIQLRNHTMRLPPVSPQPVSTRLHSVTSETDGPAVFDSDTQYVSGRIDASTIRFRYFDGVLDSLALAFSPDGISVDQPPEGWNAVHPTTVDAYLHIFESVSATASTAVQVHTFRNNTAIASTELAADDVPLGRDTTVVFTGLAGLIADYPDSIATSGSMVISGPVAMYETETVALDVELRAPLEFILSPVEAPGEVMPVNTEGIEDVRGGSTRIRIWNRLPVGGRVYVLADRDSARIAPGSGADVDTLGDVSIPVPDRVGGRAVGEAYTETVVAFPPGSDLLELFRNPPFFTRTHISLPGSQGDTLIAHGSDYIRVQVIAELDYHVRTGGDE